MVASHVSSHSRIDEAVDCDLTAWHIENGHMDSLVMDLEASIAWIKAHLRPGAMDDWD